MLRACGQHPCRLSRVGLGWGHFYVFSFFHVSEYSEHFLGIWKTSIIYSNSSLSFSFLKHLFFLASIYYYINNIRRTKYVVRCQTICQLGTILWYYIITTIFYNIQVGFRRHAKRLFCPGTIKFLSPILPVSLPIIWSIMSFSESRKETHIKCQFLVLETDVWSCWGLETEPY